MTTTTAAMAKRNVTSAVYMDTLITVDVPDAAMNDDSAECVRKGFGWFDHVEKLCSRFDENSELSRLSASPAGAPVQVSPLLFELIEFACAVAANSDGAFDPTIGRAMQARGFNRNYRTGERTISALDPKIKATYRDIVLDPGDRTVTLTQPLILDLGAVAKGFAIDLAAQELNSFPSFLINAGGDILARGKQSPGTPWRIGIRHPREAGALIDAFSVTDAAVCTSGDYERRTPDGEGGHHLLDPLSGKPVVGIASVTVIAPSAMLADALSTAAFVLQPERGLELLERQGVEGLIVSTDLRSFETKGLSKYRP